MSLTVARDARRLRCSKGTDADAARVPALAAYKEFRSIKTSFFQEIVCAMFPRRRSSSVPRAMS
ncbi:MAG: hypothetical protein WBP69_14135, partial [Terriglobales bacterium]